MLLSSQLSATSITAYVAILVFLGDNEEILGGSVYLRSTRTFRQVHIEQFLCLSKNRIPNRAVELQHTERSERVSEAWGLWNEPAIVKS